jgi:hypothetical protein
LQRQGEPQQRERIRYRFIAQGHQHHAGHVGRGKPDPQNPLPRASSPPQNRRSMQTTGMPFRMTCRRPDPARRPVA